jgi:ribosomal protein L3 glutamine methyltransferase
VTVVEAIEDGARRLQAAGVSFGHGTTNAYDESAWLVLWALGLPLDLDLHQDSRAHQPIDPADRPRLATLFEARITQRMPAAYLTGEAWLQGVPFHVDERVIVPRSLIAEPLADGLFDDWLGGEPARVLDLCTGNGSLAVLSAMAWPGAEVTGTDLSAAALEVAHRNGNRHGLADRIRWIESDGLASAEIARRGPFDLVLCNPPYVSHASMQNLPPEFRKEPAIALDGNRAGSSDGMDFIRPLLVGSPQAPGVARLLTDDGILVLEIGHEREHFEAAFPMLFPASADQQPVWLESSGGPDQVLLLSRAMLAPLCSARSL